MISQLQCVLDVRLAHLAPSPSASVKSLADVSLVGIYPQQYRVRGHCNSREDQVMKQCCHCKRTHSPCWRKVGSGTSRPQQRIRLQTSALALLAARSTAQMFVRQRSMDAGQLWVPIRQRVAYSLMVQGPPEKPLLCNACGAHYLCKRSLDNYWPKEASNIHQQSYLAEQHNRQRHTVPLKSIRYAHILRPE